MMKRYRRADVLIEYSEVWQSGPGAVVVHSGVVGLRGTSVSVGPLPGESGRECQERLVREVEERGFAALSESEVRDVEVCLLSGNDLLNSRNGLTHLKQRHLLESLLDEALGWTGNGSCTGGDIGVDGMNIYCEVVNVAAATNTIRELLEQENLSDRATISRLPDEADE